MGPPRSRYAPVIRKPDMVNGRARHTTVELYKPQGSDEEDQGAWGFLSDTGLTDCECAAVCMHGILYVAGPEGETIDILGFEGANKSRVISYDPSKQEWEALPSMSVSRVCMRELASGAFSMSLADTAKATMLSQLQSAMTRVRGSGGLCRA